MSESAEGGSRVYWKAVISALPTPEKRDAAWEFYLDRFAGGNAGDTLSGLILLLEANGAYLLTLPEKFNAGLTRPVTEELGALREELRDHVERQRASLRATDVANETLEKANRVLANNAAELAGKVSEAVRNINVAGLAKQVHTLLELSIVAPLRLALSGLPEHSRQIAAATRAAESGVDTWRKVHLGGIVLIISLAALLLGGVLFGCAWIQLERHFNERLAAEITRLRDTRDTFEHAALLNVPVHIIPWLAHDGTRVPSGYKLVIDHAEEVNIQPVDDGKRGIISFKAQRSIDQVEELRSRLNALRKQTQP